VLSRHADVRRACVEPETFSSRLAMRIAVAPEELRFVPTVFVRRLEALPAEIS
jgi:hypothetical protein